MKNEFYTWEQVRAYGIIALHDLINSANEINITNFKLFIDPLQTLCGKEGVDGYSKLLLSKEKSNV